MYISNYFYILKILIIFVLNVYLCILFCLFFFIKSDIGFYYIENNVDESIFYLKYCFFKFLSCVIFEYKMYFKIF